LRDTGSHAISRGVRTLRDTRCMTERPALVSSNTMTAEEALFVAAGCRTVNLDRLSIWVIVGEYKPDPDDGCEPAFDPGREWPFELGEILLVESRRDDSGYGYTEFGGKGRDLAYWGDRADDCFSWRGDFDMAWTLSAQVKSGIPAGIYEWMDDRWQRPSDQDHAYHSWCSDPEWYVNVGLFNR
jgi:hypothetical protein